MTPTPNYLEALDEVRPRRLVSCLGLDSRINTTEEEGSCTHRLVIRQLQPGLVLHGPLAQVDRCEGIQQSETFMCSSLLSVRLFQTRFWITPVCS